MVANYSLPATAKAFNKREVEKNHIHNYGRVTQAKLMNSLRKGYSIYSRVVDGKLASIGSHYSANAQAKVKCGCALTTRHHMRHNAANCQPIFNSQRARELSFSSFFFFNCVSLVLLCCYEMAETNCILNY